MKNLAFAAIFAVLLCGYAEAQTPLSYYLPQDVTYDKNVPTPQSLLGYEVGDWHVRPDQIVQYFEALAKASPRCQLEIYARTHEARPLVVLTVSSAENLARLPEIQDKRQGLYLPNFGKPDLADMPVVLWMGYSVHGDEPSGANASLLYAYYLAAAQGPKVEALLNDSVVLLDPCLNPDGLARFAHWANMHRGKNAVADPSHREHRQPWPSGRTNHYWFDLNRDWLLLQHPESRGRLKIFHAWRPNVVTDFHEMGTNSSYFFQPGVRSRHNPLIPAKNFDLTAKVAEFHAKKLDQLGSLYYTQESYDDFYFGKGSTYPDVHGSVGILFEQGSSRGHAQKSRYGTVTFPFTIRNQLTTSLSSHNAAVAMREELLDYQRSFSESSIDAAIADETKAWVFSSPESVRRARKLVDLLASHKIEVCTLAKDFTQDGKKFEKGKAFIVVGNQRQYRLMKSMFEIRTTFNDPVFYDVSAWNMFAAFDLDVARLNAGELKKELVGPAALSWSKPWGGILNQPKDGSAPYAWMFHWDSFESARLLNRLLDHGVKALVVATPLQVELSGLGDKKKFERGSILIPRGIQQLAATKVKGLVEAEAGAVGVEVFSVASGLTTKGADLGSPSIGSMKATNALIIVDGSTSSYEAGEVWHLLDARLGAQASLVEADRFEKINLSGYTHILAVSGAEGALKHKVDDLKQWVSRGGILITQRSAAHWAGEKLLGLTKPKTKPQAKDSKSESTNSTYADRNRRSALARLSGAIFNATLDVTHPLGWGFKHKEIALWRKGTTVMLPSKRGHSNPIKYTKNPLFSGFAGAAAQAKLADTVAASVDRMGSGVIVRFADDMNFRAYWRGTERLYLNAIFHARFVAGSGGVMDANEEESHGHGH